jgi:hypothetical protein
MAKVKLLVMDERNRTAGGLLPLLILCPCLYNKTLGMAS